MPIVSISIAEEIIRAVECEDGYRLHFRVWPAQGSPVATLVLINGAMGHSGWFRELARLMTGLQINVVGADRRGSGLNQEEHGDARSRHLLLSDLRKLIEQEKCELPVYLAGWCWGALLAVNAALEFGSLVNGLALLAPGLFPSQKINHAMQHNLKMLEEAHSDSSLLASPLTEEMFTVIRECREFIASDDLAVRAFTMQFVRVSREMQMVATVRLAQLTNPVLLLLAGKDQTVDNERTLKALQALPAAAVTSATIPCNHGMQFEAPQEMAMHLSKWISQSVPVSGGQAAP